MKNLFLYFVGVLSVLSFFGCMGKSDSGLDKEISISPENKISQNVISSFQKSDMKRRQWSEISVKQDKEPTDEYDVKISTARNLGYKGRWDESAEALKALLKNEKISARKRSGIVVAIADTDFRRRRFAETVATVDVYLNDATLQNVIQTKDRAVLLRMKSDAQSNLNDVKGRAETLTARLNEFISEDDAYRTKIQIIQSYSRLGYHKDASLIYLALADAKQLSEERVLECLGGALSELRAMNDIPAMEQMTERIFRLQKDTAKRNNILYWNAWKYRDVKKLDKAKEIFLSIVRNETLPPQLRIDAFMQFGNIIRGIRNADKKQLLTLAEETVLKIKNIHPVNYGHLHVYLMKLSVENLSDRTLAEKFANNVLSNQGTSCAAKLEAIRLLAENAALNGNFAEAGKIVDKGFLYERATLYELIQHLRFASNLYKWQEKCEECIAYLRSKQPLFMEKSNMPNSAYIQVLSNHYLSFQRFDDAAKVWMDFGIDEGAYKVYAPYLPEKAAKIADRILADTSKSDQIRADLLPLDSSVRACNLRKKYPELMDKISVNALENAIRSASTGGNSKLVLEFAPYFFKRCTTPAYVMLQIIFQASLLENNIQMLQDCAQKYAVDNVRLSTEQKFFLRFQFDTFQNAKKQSGNFRTFYENYSFPKNYKGKIRADLLLETAALALNARMDILADEIYKQYKGLYQKELKKNYCVTFSDLPICNLTGFLAMPKQPEKQLMDRKYGGNMDFLDTDVSTGDRGKGINSESSVSQLKPTEMQIAADEAGIHFLFTSYDGKKDEVEAGLTGAGAYEMYLAPGPNQPYFCFLPDLGAGTNSIWNTTYENPQWRRISMASQSKDTRCERHFTEDGYRYYMFLSWERFFDKLPEGKADYWEFENVHWSRNGGFSWNGLKTIHGRSTWGKLTFNISLSQWAKVKRQIIFSARKAYLREKTTNATIHGCIDKWSNDNVLGDPDFYNNYAKKTVERLDSYLPLVQPNMSDETIHKLFEEVVQDWFNIRFILSDLRRQYLEEALTEK